MDDPHLQLMDNSTERVDPLPEIDGHEPILVFQALEESSLCLYVGQLLNHPQQGAASLVSFQFADLHLKSSDNKTPSMRSLVPFLILLNASALWNRPLQVTTFISLMSREQYFWIKWALRNF